MFGSPSRPGNGITHQRLSARIATRVPVESATFQMLRVARKLTYRAMARHDKPAALRYSGVAYRRFPHHPFAAPLHARALVMRPITATECERALSFVRPVLAEHPTEVSLLNVYDEVLLAMLHTGVPVSTVAEHLVTLAELAPLTAPARISRFVRRQLTFGRHELATALLQLLGDRREPRELALLLHAIACAAGDADRAEQIADQLGDEPWWTPEDECRLATERAMLRHQPHVALERLLALRPQRDADYSLYLLAAYRSVGRHDKVVEYLDGIRHGLSDATAKAYRYDALMAVGDLDRAGELAATIHREEFGDLRLLRIRADHSKRLGQDAVDQLIAEARHFGVDRSRSAQQVAALGAYFEVGLLDEMEQIEETVRPEDLGPSATLHLARAHYSRRRLSRAVQLLDTLHGATDRWDAEKLRARIQLERGDFAGAIDRRLPLTATSDDLDEILYHALLHERRFSEAFSMFSSKAEQGRLVAVFGSKAESGQGLSRVQRRLVISQSGPGDEITLASVYPALSGLSDELVVTCDPRLETLLSRSFPDVTFLPVERLRPGSVGFLARGRPPRAENPLFDLLTAEAMDIAAECDGVVVARSLQHLAIDSTPSRPYDRYIMPDERLAADLAARWGGDRAPVGVVWRSELRSPMRDIHYLEVGDLAPLLEQDLTFVCLQYDASASEREELKRLTGGRVHFPDDINLRDDFESAAALSVGLSAAVGIGTTALELAAAVGTPAVMMQPTHFGTWRAMDADGSDFWHRSLRVVTLDNPWDRKSLVARCALIVDQLVDSLATKGR